MGRNRVVDGWRGDGRVGFYHETGARMNEQLLPTCVWGSIAVTGDTMHRIPVLVCQSCGIVRQSVEMDREQLAAWYRERYFQAGVYQHTYDHDCEVAELRLKAYHLPTEIKLLDVGAGHGAVVDP